MKIKFFVGISILFYSLFFSIKISAQNTFAVRGQVLMTPHFCGGMRLTEEQMAQYIPYPMKNKKMFIRTGDSNNLKNPVFKEFTTDVNGIFCVDLPPGTYGIVDHLKNDSTHMKSILKQYSKRSGHFEKADEQCLINWLSTPDATFTISNDHLYNVLIYYHENCSWNILCVQYLGPPPS